MGRTFKLLEKGLKEAIALKQESQELEAYPSFLRELKEKIQTHQLSAASALNQELIRLYWEIGKSINQKQEKEGWGSKIINRLSKDLQQSFPGIKGFSTRNLKYMRLFARSYVDIEVVKFVACVPWGHNMVLLDKLDNQTDRLWYARKTLENGWSRSILEMWLDSKLHLREGKAISNFHCALPKPQSDLANQVLKDPYCFDFLSLSDKYTEREVEEGLLENIQKFLIELGAGFAFVGRQYPVTVDDTDYFIDLLFYHLKLRCYYVIDLKADKFMPEHVG